MTLLHMDKRGLQATLHVSFPRVRAVVEYRVCSSTHLPRPTETLVKVDSDLLYTYDISQQINFAYTPVQCRAPLYSGKKNKTAVLTVMRWGNAV